MSRRPLDPRFADGKDAEAMRTIGEVSQALGIKPHVLRYWEQQFPMLSPLKRSGGRRLYRPEDIALLDRIDRLVNREGYTLKGARKALESGTEEAAAGYGGQVSAPDPDYSAAEPAAELPLEPADPTPQAATDPAAEILPQLRALRSRLAAAL